MTLRGRRILGLLFATVLVFTGIGSGFAQSDTGRIVVVPDVPDVGEDDVEIPDLENAPPVARDPIAKLTTLDAYPLDDLGRAEPNRGLDQRTAAYMVLNTFGRQLGDSFPMGRDDALRYLSFVMGVELPPDGIVTAGMMRDYVLAFGEVPAEDPAQLRTVIQENYPALLAGNVDTPLTRAGGALMILIALEYLGEESE